MTLATARQSFFSVCIASVTLLAGCSTVSALELDGVIAVVGSSSTGLEEAAEGELVTMRGGCLALNTSEGEFLLVWPPGATLDSRDGEVSVKVPGSPQTYVVGEVIAIGGGGYSGSGQIEFEVPENCTGYTEVYLVNGQG